VPDLELQLSRLELQSLMDLAFPISSSLVDLCPGKHRRGAPGLMYRCGTRRGAAHLLVVVCRRAKILTTWRAWAWVRTSLGADPEPGQGEGGGKGMSM